MLLSTRLSWTHPARSKILNLVGGDFPGKLPNMRLVAVEQLCKMEYVALEVNIASFSLCLHWWTCCFVMPGSFMWPSSKSAEQIHFICRPARGCHSRVLASIHLITVDAGLLLGYCRADAGLLLNGCRISFLASFGAHDLRPTWGLSSNVLIIDWLVEAEPGGE